MNQSTLRTILERAENWADEDRQELADYVRVIEARRSKFYKVTQSERSALNEALEQADRGDFATEAMLAGSAKRHGA